VKGPLEGLSTDLPLKCNRIGREGRHRRPLPELRRARRLEGPTGADPVGEYVIPLLLFITELAIVQRHA